MEPVGSYLPVEQVILERTAKCDHVVQIHENGSNVLPLKTG
jgi:hypothetical protein